MSLFATALLSSATLFAFSATISAQEPEWVQDFAAAKAKAKADSKDLLIDFTGSDWCIWCKRLDGEVFSTDEFKGAIGKTFVLVKLDYPKDKGLVTPEIAKQNEQLQKDFGIQGFPTVYLTDSEGRPYAKTGYEKGGPKPYLENLAKLHEAHVARDAGFAKAKAAKGVDRAKALADALSGLDEELVLTHYSAEMGEIVSLDADGKAGLKEKFGAMLDRGAQKKTLEELEVESNNLAQKEKWDDLLTYLDKALAANKGKKMVEQKATFFKAMVMVQGKKDTEKGLALLDAAKAIDPESEIGQRIDQIKEAVKTEAGNEVKEGEAKKGDGKKEGEGKKEGGGK